MKSNIVEQLDDADLFEKLLGQKKDEYEFIDKIGSGSLSVIFRAKDKETKTPVILKLIEKNKLENGPKNYLEKQVNNEIKILELCKNKCENIIQIQNHFKEDLSFGIIFEDCQRKDGQTSLKDYINDKGPLIQQEDISIIKQIFSGIVNGLSFLYDNKIIHRDIKTENIYLQKKNKILIPKIADFGVATFESENNYDLTGTFAYMAPEVFKQSIYDIKSDMWSLGITFYEIITGYTPYGKFVTKNKLKNLFAKKILYFALTGNDQLDILIRRLLIIDPDKRMTFPELKKYIFSNDFLNENIKFVNNDKINEETYNEIIKNKINYDSVPKDKDYLKECTLDNLSREEQMSRVIKSTDLDSIPDIMDYCNGDIDNENINNIIYYDENVNTFKGSIYGDCVQFERETNGAFIFCSNEISLKYIMEEIKKANEKEKRIIFNLIVTGQSCEKVIWFLLGKDQNDNYYDLIEKICIFCCLKKNHEEKKQLYPKIDGVYDKAEDVINKFIKKFASKDIRPFVITKLLTLNDYKDKYHKRHETIAKYYGEFDEKLFQEALNKIIEYVSKDKNIILNNVNDLILSFMEFGKNNDFGDIQAFNKLLIKEYTKDTFYTDLNKWLLSLNKNSYEYTSYFTGRFMFCLNSFAKSQKKYNNENNKIYRGLKMPYSSLQLYERAKNQIIILSSFTSTSIDIDTANYFSGRDNDKFEEEFKKKLKFSVIITIENVYKENWVTNGVDIQQESDREEEFEILYLPFSFYYVKDVKIDFEKKTADIELKTCGKKEIIEEKIKLGKDIKIIKEEEENLVIVVDK